MTYEFAKQLRDSGFPMPDGIEMREHEPNICDYGPHLSALLAAFGTEFGQLRKAVSPLGTDGWWANASGDRFAVFAVTPEEAVALLWLALHPSTFSAEEG